MATNCTIIGILLRFSGQTVPAWPFGVNLSTLVSILSNISQASIAVITAEAIGQTKWHWFKKPRPLQHFNVFDTASVGWIGSIKLLGVAPASFLALLGIVVPISSLAIGPFTQQAIKLVSCLEIVPDIVASLPVTNSPAVEDDTDIETDSGDTPYGPSGHAMRRWADIKMAMLQALQFPDDNSSTVAATCPSGNCTFSSFRGITHSSLGICSSCIDTSSLVTCSQGVLDPETIHAYSSLNCTLPQMLTINVDPFTLSTPVWINISVEYDLAWASQVMNSSFEDVSSASIANITVLAFTQSPCSNHSGVVTCPHNITLWNSDLFPLTVDYQATTCSLYTCVKNYHALVNDGILHEQVISTIPVSKYLPNDGESIVPVSSSNLTLINIPCLFDNKTYVYENLSAIPVSEHLDLIPVYSQGLGSPPLYVPKNCIYALDGFLAESLQQFISRTLLSGSCFPPSDFSLNVDCGSSWWMTPLFNKGISNLTSISLAMESLATTLTNKFRGTSNPWYGANTSVQGEVWQTSVCVSFDWPWLAFPLTVFALTAAQLFFVIAANVKDRDHPIWKTSTLPMLFYGSMKFRDWTDRVMDVDELEKRSKGVLARLRYESDWAGLEDVTGTETLKGPSMRHLIRTGERQEEQSET